MKNFSGLQDKCGYHFKDESLLRLALTHSSYANENKLGMSACNERIEFLGDAVLEIVVSRYLFLNYTDKAEGEMTKLRASIVCEPTLALCSKEIELSEYILLSRGEDKTGGRQRPSICSDAFEALIGAIYLDGGLDEASNFIHRFVLVDVEEKISFSDSKTRLQEIIQGRKTGEVLSYRLLEEGGPDHAKTYTCGVFLGENMLGKGCGTTKKSAQQQAAYAALKQINN